MDLQAEVLARDGTPFVAVPLVPGGIRLGDLLYGSHDLEQARLAGVVTTVLATVDPVDPAFALVILPDKLRLVRAEALFSPGEFQRQVLGLLRVIEGIDAVLDEAFR